MTASEHPDMIYRLAGRDDWARARQSGAYEGAEVDARDGYIHFSTAAQLRQTAALHYRDRDDVVLLAVPVAAVARDLRWEESRGGDLFPHLYANLPASAVAETYALALGDDGAPVIEDAMIARGRTGEGS